MSENENKLKEQLTKLEASMAENTVTVESLKAELARKDAEINKMKELLDKSEKALAGAAEVDKKNVEQLTNISAKNKELSDKLGELEAERIKASRLEKIKTKLNVDQAKAEKLYATVASLNDNMFEEFVNVQTEFATKNEAATTPAAVIDSATPDKAAGSVPAATVNAAVEATRASIVDFLTSDRKAKVSKK